MNVELLRKIAAVIQEKPDEFDMESYAGDDNCGTTHCIGGWACHFSKIRPEDSYLGTAMKALDLDVDQGCRLFYCDEWPERYLGAEDDWKPTPAQAAARIEHFIATGGAE